MNGESNGKVLDLGLRKSMVRGLVSWGNHVRLLARLDETWTVRKFKDGLRVSKVYLEYEEDRELYAIVSFMF